MSRRVCISNDSLSSYGTRVLTSGMNVEQYYRDPVLLYIHERGSVVGYVKDVKVKGDEVIGELVFDEATELSRRCKRRLKLGSPKMVGTGPDIIEMNEDGVCLVAGRTSPTITKSKPFEMSVVNIGADDDTLVLKKDGKRTTLGRDGGHPLPELSNNNQKTRNEMEDKTIVLQLDLSETVTDAEIVEKIGEFKTTEEENRNLREERDELTLASITSPVERVIGEKRITTDKKNEFTSLNREIGVEKLTSVFSAISLQMKLSAVLGQYGAAKTDVPAIYKELSEAPDDKLLEMHEQQPDKYKWLYKIEYEVECEI